MDKILKNKNQKSQRRIPVQARSIARVNKILDTAAELMSNSNEEIVNSHLIAAKAGVSIGSFYQFFPNVGSVKTALIERLLDQYYEMIDNTITQHAELTDLVEFSRHMVSATNDFYLNQPDLLKLLVSARNSHEFYGVNRRMSKKIQKRVAEHFITINPSLEKAELMRKVGVAVSISDIMMMNVWSAIDQQEQELYLNDWISIIENYSKLAIGHSQNRLKP